MSKAARTNFRRRVKVIATKSKIKNQKAKIKTTYQNAGRGNRVTHDHGEYRVPCLPWVSF
jgi:hypothetical protein